MSTHEFLEESEHTVEAQRHRGHDEREPDLGQGVVGAAGVCPLSAAPAAARAPFFSAQSSLVRSHSIDSRSRVSLAPSRGAFLLLYHRRQELEIGESEIAFGMPWNAKHMEKRGRRLVRSMTRAHGPAWTPPGTFLMEHGRVPSARFDGSMTVSGTYKWSKAGKAC